ncbi:hypothetical protein [Escherichia phage phi467]|nr:hypothetical protein [Escherichia phage phi467]
MINSTITPEPTLTGIRLVIELLVIQLRFARSTTVTMTNEFRTGSI